MLSQLNKTLSIEATLLRERDKRFLIKHFTASSQFVEVRQVLTRKQSSWRKLLEAHKFKHRGRGQKEDGAGGEGARAGYGQGGDITLLGEMWEATDPFPHSCQAQTDPHTVLSTKCLSLLKPDQWTVFCKSNFPLYRTSCSGP